VGAVDRVRQADFPIVLRGYDRAAVDAYVADVAQLVAELEATQLPETVVERALDDVGEQTSAILKRAHEAAEDIAARSRAQADSRIEQAEREAELTRREAEDQVRRLEDDMRSIWQERQRLIENIRHLADDVLALADDAIDRLPAPGEDETVAEEPGDEEPGEVEQTQALAQADVDAEVTTREQIPPPRAVPEEDREPPAPPSEGEPADEAPPTAVEGGPDEDTAERPSRP
jgi:cell division initiation protein